MRVQAVIAMIALFGTVLVSGQDYDDWIKSVDTLGSSIMFTCENAPLHPKDSGFVENTTASRWLLPSYKFLGMNESLDHVSVSEDGRNLTVVNVQKEDFGVYYCLLRTDDTDELRMVKWGLNMKGPYFENGWEKYRTNFIIGISAFFGFLALVAIVIGVYHFRWRPPVSPHETNASDITEIPMNSGKIQPQSVDAVQSTSIPSSNVYPQVSTAQEPEKSVTAPAPVPEKVPAADVKIVSEKPMAAYDNAAATTDNGTPVSTTAL